MWKPNTILFLLTCSCMCLAPANFSCRTGTFEDVGINCPADEVIFEGFSSPPRLRFGSYPSSTLATNFLGRDIGSHGYNFTLSEKNGIVYTLRGGHIDTAHVRIAADWTAYLTARAYRTIMDNKSSFSFKLGADLSRHYIKIHHPANWTELSGQERLEIAKEVSFALGPYLAFEATTWHEILTWYGFKCVYIYTEFPSAFSWEDSYSNLLGTIIAVSALQDANHSYNEALTIAFDKELEKLSVQPAYFAQSATDRMKGRWFSGGGLFFVDIKKRNFDVGLDDGFITPTLLEGIRENESIGATSYRVPNLDVLANYGFSAKVETEPAEWEKGKIFRIAFGRNPGRRIELAAHLARIMDDIETKAAEKYGHDTKIHASKLTQTQTGKGSLRTLAR